MDEESERFFTRSADCDPLIRVIIETLRSNNDRSGFVHNFIADRGVAYWDFGIFLKREGQTFNLLIPVASTSNLFAGFIVADNLFDSLRIGYVPFNEQTRKDDDVGLLANYFSYKLHLADTVAGLRFVESGVKTKYLNDAGEWCVDMWVNVDNYGLTYKGTHCKSGDVPFLEDTWGSIDTKQEKPGGGGGGSGGTISGGGTGGGGGGGTGGGGGGGTGGGGGGGTGGGGTGGDGGTGGTNDGNLNSKEDFPLSSAELQDLCSSLGNNRTVDLTYLFQNGVTTSTTNYVKGIIGGVEVFIRSISITGPLPQGATCVLYTNPNNYTHPVFPEGRGVTMHYQSPDFNCLMTITMLESEFNKLPDIVKIRQ